MVKTFGRQIFVFCEHRLSCKLLNWMRVGSNTNDERLDHNRDENFGTYAYTDI